MLCSLQQRFKLNDLRSSRLSACLLLLKLLFVMKKKFKLIEVCSSRLSKCLLLLRLLSVVQIEEAIVPDGIHPSPPGMQLLAECIAIAVHRLARPAGK